MNYHNQPVIQARNLVKDFPGSNSLLKQSFIRALNDVSFDLHAGEALAIVGESGSGKSTTAKLLTRLHELTDGEMWCGEQNISEIPVAKLKEYRRQVQMIFQDPYGSLNPVHTIYHHLERPLRVHGKTSTRAETRDRVNDLLEKVGLSPASKTARKYPFEISGGQRQRVCIARTLAVGASVVLADEPTSALDVSIRLGILNLMIEMKENDRVAFMYITHDIATARYFAERTAVMYVGHMIEWGKTAEIIEKPQHPYTQMLIAAVPDPSRKRNAESATHSMRMEIPTWGPESKGCPFVGRCKHARQACSEAMPPISRIDDNHFVRCYLFD